MTNQLKIREKESGLWLVKIVNTVSYFICRLVLIIRRVKVEIDPSIFAYRKKAGQGLILISNHEGIADPWIICASIPVKTFFSLMPVRIMGAFDFADPVASFFNKLGIVKIVYYLYGVMGFRKDWTFEEKLAPFIACLKNGGTILVFPEGRLNHQPGVEIFRQGIIHIYNSARSDILPFAINKSRKSIWVHIGPITHIPEAVAQSEDPGDKFPSRQCEYLRQQVANLYDQNN